MVSREFSNVYWLLTLLAYHMLQGRKRMEDGHPDAEAFVPLFLSQEMKG